MISAVIPIYNEEESLSVFHSELAKVLPTIDKDFEIIYVDDGSTDASFSILLRFRQKNRNVRVFSFRKNQGKAEALTFGFQKAQGEYIVTLDADLQDRPDQIHKLLKKVHEGYEVVCGWRKNRNDSLPKIVASKLFNWIVNIFWDLKIHDYNCGLKVLSKDAAKSLQLYGGLHRFIPQLLDQEGFSISEVAVIHEKRKYGKSKYGFSKLWRDLPDIFTIVFLSKYSRRPLHFFGTIGFLLLLIGFLCLIYLSVIHAHGEPITRRPLFYFGMILVLSGFQIFFTGFLADLIINVSQKNKREFQLKYSSDDQN